MKQDQETITFGKVNAAGRSALIEWLESVLTEDRVWAAENFANDMIARADGSNAEDCGISFELRGMYARSGNPETYLLGKGEIDLITQDDMGNEIERRTA